MDLGSGDHPNSLLGAPANIQICIIYQVKIEVRAVGLKTFREARGLTQRQLAKDIGISQNYIPALEGGARRPGPGVQERLVKYFGCRFEDLFQLVLVNPETSQEQVLQATGQKPRVTAR